MDITDSPSVGVPVDGSATTKAFRERATLNPSYGVIMDTTASAMIVMLDCPD